MDRNFVYDIMKCGAAATLSVGILHDISIQAHTTSGERSVYIILSVPAESRMEILLHVGPLMVNSVIDTDRKFLPGAQDMLLKCEHFVPSGLNIVIKLKRIIRRSINEKHIRIYVEA